MGTEGLKGKTITGGSPNGLASKQEANERPTVEPDIDAELLVQQAREIFPAGYQTSVSVIQGVALYFLTSTTFSVHVGGWQHAALLLRAAMSLFGIVHVSFGYLWFTAMVRWSVTWVDIAIPYVLGVAEIYMAYRVDSENMWWWALLVFVIVGGLAYGNTRLHVSNLRFAPNAEDARIEIRQLLDRMISAAAIFAAVVLVFILIAKAYNATWLLHWGTCALLPLALVIALVAQHGLHDVFKAAGVERPGWLGSTHRTR